MIPCLTLCPSRPRSKGIQSSRVPAARQSSFFLREKPRLHSGHKGPHSWLERLRTSEAGRGYAFNFPTFYPAAFDYAWWAVRAAAAEQAPPCLPDCCSLAAASCGPIALVSCLLSFFLPGCLPLSAGPSPSPLPEPLLWSINPSVSGPGHAFG